MFNSTLLFTCEKRLLEYQATDITDRASQLEECYAKARPHSLRRPAERCWKINWWCWVTTSLFPLCFFKIGHRPWGCSNNTTERRSFATRHDSCHASRNQI